MNSFQIIDHLPHKSNTFLQIFNIYIHQNEILSNKNELNKCVEQICFERLNQLRRITSLKKKLYIILKKYHKITRQNNETHRPVQI